MDSDLLQPLEVLLARQGEIYQQHNVALTQQALAQDHLATELREFRMVIERFMSVTNLCEQRTQTICQKLDAVLDTRKERLTWWEKAYVPLLLALATLLGSVITYVLSARR